MLCIRQVTGANGESLYMSLTSNRFELKDVDAWGNVDSRICFTSNGKTKALDQLDELIYKLQSLRKTYAAQDSISKIFEER